MAGECRDKKNSFKCNEGGPGKNQGENSENKEDMSIRENDEGRWGTYHGAGCVNAYAGDNHSPAMTGHVTPQARPRAALDSMNTYDTFCKESVSNTCGSTRRSRHTFSLQSSGRWRRIDSVSAVKMMMQRLRVFVAVNKISLGDLSLRVTQRTFICTLLELFVGGSPLRKRILNVKYPLLSDVACHATTSMRVPEATSRASGLFSEKSVRDLRFENRARIGGKPERMS